MSPPNPPFTTEIRPYGKAAIAEAARLIGEGLPVAMPTETVYGLAADATNGEAVARIYEAKGRPSFNPLIVHVQSLAQAKDYGVFSEAAEAAAGHYWPGPLTIVVERRADSPIAELVTAGLPTIALRCPKHPAMQDLLQATGTPLAAPSANASGTISATSADHVMKTLEGRIPLIVDGGRTEQGLESTIVRFTGDTVTLLRPGPINFEEIVRLSSLPANFSSGKIEAPGQLQSHYAPSKPLRLNVEAPEAGEWMIGFGPVPGHETLSNKGDLVEAAARLFEALHRAEASNRDAIAVAPIPQTGIGAAINDRLKRAAAPR
ncbi:MAG TPA: L-threonylcarbamoyladenylate synthase [Allosphingosinicella sp.]|uniref:L-threonylcarbamoyladenylate synthase n=1 Tax=Allosphingosinicella sp. TaxID=2823234 RepID=UPI002ED90E71